MIRMMLTKEGDKKPFKGFRVDDLKRSKAIEIVTSIIEVEDKDIYVEYSETVKNVFHYETITKEMISQSRKTLIGSPAWRTLVGGYARIKDAPDILGEQIKSGNY